MGCGVNFFMLHLRLWAFAISTYVKDAAIVEIVAATLTSKCTLQLRLLSRLGLLQWHPSMFRERTPYLRPGQMVQDAEGKEGRLPR